MTKHVEESSYSCVVAPEWPTSRSELFKIHQIIGNPIHEVQRFNDWNVDELIYLDISRSDSYDLRRDDAKVNGLSDALDILKVVGKTCFMPLTWGGRIRTVNDMREHISRGADKITINSQAVRTPALITEGARLFGSQAIVVSIDVGRNSMDKAEVFVDGGRTRRVCIPLSGRKRRRNAEQGKSLWQVIERDGVGNG